MTIQRDEILASACELYLRKGMEGFSMRRLAEDVGVTAPALYRHFDGKEDVLLSVVGEAYKLFYEYLRRALVGSTPAERFRMAGAAYLDFALEHPRFYEIIHAPLEAMGIEQVPEALQAQGCAVGQFWHDRIRECIDAGLIRSADPEAISLTMWSHAHGLISLYLRGMLGEMDEETFRNLYLSSTHRILDGLAAKGAAAFHEDAPATADSTTETVS